MLTEVVLTSAVTGSGDTADKHPGLPILPKDIAQAAIDSAKAGASIAHLHVRNPKTGKASRDPELFREVVDRIRSADVDIVLNLTGGMGGDLIIGPPENPMAFDLPNSDLAPALERYVHVEQLLPEICSLDCGSMNFGTGNYLAVNTMPHLREMARLAQRLGVKPELECFELGHVTFANQLIAEGLIDPAPLFQLCTGVPGGAPATTGALKAMVEELPVGSNWSAFGISRMQMPMMVQSVLLGGNVRVGLEDNLFLDRGVLATNAQLVERATTILSLLGCRILTPQEAREKLGLRKR